jgi:c-di-GMP-binding flagellar brake protein YcgR
LPHRLRYRQEPSESMPIPEHDRREHIRLKARVPIEIHIEANDSPLRGAASDLSLSGCYMETIFLLPISANLEMKLQLEDILLVLGTVVTCDPQVGNRIRFSRMLPEDVEQLRVYLEAAEKHE